MKYLPDVRRRLKILLQRGNYEEMVFQENLRLSAHNLIQEVLIGI